MKLNQVIAIEKGTKSRSLQELTEAHHTLQKLALSWADSLREKHGEFRNELFTRSVLACANGR